MIIYYLAVEPVGVGGLLRETHYARWGGLDSIVFHVLDIAIDVACEQQLVQHIPSVHHFFCQAVAEAGELGGGSVVGQEVDGGDEVLLVRFLVGADILNHDIVAQVAEIAYAVKEPEGGGGGVLAHGTVALAEAEGHAVDDKK